MSKENKGKGSGKKNNPVSCSNSKPVSIPKPVGKPVNVGSTIHGIFTRETTQETTKNKKPKGLS